ncbi:MAG: inositol monophosphatase family protein [Deltaproteobacteria bacterium]
MSVDPNTLVRALEVAIEAARDAGALIRAETHRPEGPRGGGHHADVDDEAEALIRARLVEAFPSFGYIAEDSSPVRAAAPVRWYVDPNDGTAAFLRGHRGNAVSIALVDGDLPVLGVVYAPCAPDDRGDLIAWAEGHTLTRNGCPVTRAPLPDSLTTDVVVALSQHADVATRENLALIAPARFRAIASIAYRLALAAVGDVDAGVSLNHPTAWDFAGGHALLRAVGGDLIDERGNPVRYASPVGCTNVFGGAPTVARALAALDWSRLMRKRHSRRPLAQLSPEAHEHDAARLSRAHGCLLGQLVGDALGSLVEFRTAAHIRRTYPDGVCELADGGVWNTLAGQPTDDSELALTLARSLVSSDRFDVDDVRAGYRAWLASGPFDVGTTTGAGLSGRPNVDSKANGALMRVSPLGIFGHCLDVSDLATAARADAALTHPNAVCLEASAVYAVTLAFAIRTGPTPHEAWRFACDYANENKLSVAIRAALHDAETDEPADYFTHAGYVLVALQSAFYWLLHGESLEHALVRVVGSGGDTDTNGAIAGALLGAVLGRDAIPSRWLRRVLSCRPLAEASGVKRPRPWNYWPVDALELAERLLLSGAIEAKRLGHPAPSLPDGVVDLLAWKQRHSEYQQRVGALREKIGTLLTELSQEAFELALCGDDKPMFDAAPAGTRISTTPEFLMSLTDEGVHTIAVLINALEIASERLG